MDNTIDLQTLEIILGSALLILASVFGWYWRTSIPRKDHDTIMEIKDDILIQRDKRINELENEWKNCQAEIIRLLKDTSKETHKVHSILNNGKTEKARKQLDEMHDILTNK